jgi:hypothetical protein
VDLARRSAVKSRPVDQILATAKDHPPKSVDLFPGFDPASTIPVVGSWRWETRGPGNRSEILTLRSDQETLVGEVQSTSAPVGVARTTLLPVQNIQRLGNRIAFDLEREFRNQRFRVTMHGVVRADTIRGWSVSDFGGGQRDTAWTATRVTLGDFSQSSDIGDPTKKGSVTYDPIEQAYTLRGGGKNMWFGRDECVFVWKRLKGDFDLDAKGLWVSPGVDPHRKYGWMVRKSLDFDSPYVDIAIHGDGLTSMQYRKEAGADTLQFQSSKKSPHAFRLTRRGQRYGTQVADAGESWTDSQTLDLDLGEEVFVGLFVCSHNAEVIEEARFQNVRVTIPAPAGFRPYRDYLGSRLEVLELATGNRRVVHTTPDSMQAPNWTNDGKGLIYNRNGKLYLFDLDSANVSLIDTAFANRNNNDHVLSWDGKQLGISHHSSDHSGQSMIYTVPVAGGVPKLVTQRGPSYLHGWSPDGRWLVYTGQRDGRLDIHRIPAAGGTEERLTDHAGVNDGSEYAPDGSSIYFNSTRSGRMQIWRMDADGKNQTQVTNAPGHHWFPHVAPDGGTLVFLSFGEDVAADDHPFYRDVYLHRLDLKTGQSSVVASLYGGQGTINVPSWSPDGKYLALVSNSQLPVE